MHIDQTALRDGGYSSYNIFTSHTERVTIYNVIKHIEAGALSIPAVPFGIPNNEQSCASDEY